MKRIFLSIFTLLVVVFPALSFATNVGGIIDTNTTWTFAKSPYNLINNVQIAYGATLSIEPGVVVSGNGYAIQVWGVLNAIGNNMSKITFKNTHIKTGINNGWEPFLINVQFSEINNGSIYQLTGGCYGSLILRDSELINTPNLYLWEPTSDCYIERNVFNNAGGISVAGGSVYIRNNVFYKQKGETYGYKDYAVGGLAGHAIVEYNSFLSTDRIALMIVPGYSTTLIIGKNNYWNTTDANVINSMIYDRHDDLACASYVDYLPILTSPHPDTPKADLTPPSSLTAKSTSSSSIVLSWKDNSNIEEGFNIERKSGACDSANTWSWLPTKGANVTTYTNTGLTPNITYSYRVRAYNADGDSAYSNCASAKTALSGTPKAPSGLKATSASSSKVNLSWKDNSGDETEFKIYRKAGAGSWSPIAPMGANIVSFTDTIAAGNTTSTTYSYYVKACNSSGCSPSTNSAVVPYQPINLSATAPSSSQINLTWTDTSNNETGFQVYMKSGGCSSSNSWGSITMTKPNITSYSNIGFSSGTTYSYKVRAYKKSLGQPYAYGYSLFSNCSNATTP